MFATIRSVRRARILALFVALAMAVTFAAACGGDDDDDSAGTGASPSAPASAVVGVKGTASPTSETAKKINAAAIPESLADGRRLGQADAPVVIQAYEDFGCSHCLDFTANIEPRILESYVATGKVAFEYKYFPLHQITAGAAIGAECAAQQDKFWAYHRALFIAQAEANEKVGPPLTEAFSAAGLKAIAAGVGLDTAAFETCTQGDEALNAVQDDLHKADDLALPGTPSFVINGEVTPAPVDFAGWKKLLDDLLK